MVVEKREEFKEFEEYKEYKERGSGGASCGACLACEAVVSRAILLRTPFRYLRSVSCDEEWTPTDLGSTTCPNLGSSARSVHDRARNSEGPLCCESLCSPRPRKRGALHGWCLLTLLPNSSIGYWQFASVHPIPQLAGQWFESLPRTEAKRRARS
jgi:hypothetical protein